MSTVSHDDRCERERERERERETTRKSPLQKT
jgi:hypothetical protein